MTNERIVITGIGVLSPSGTDPRTCFESLIERRSSTRPIPDSLAAAERLAEAGLLSEFDAAAVVGPKNVRRTARVAQLTLAAARAARSDAGITPGSYDGELACIGGTAFGGCDEARQALIGFNAQGMRGVNAFQLVNAIANIPAGMASIESAALGPCFAVSAGWATAACAIAQAFDLLRRGEATAVIAGAADAIMSQFALRTLARSGRCATSDGTAEPACRPFDPRSRGIVPSESAVLLVLETLASAERRGATPYCEILGYGEAYAGAAAGHADHVASVANAMRGALAEAALAPGDVEYVSASGSGFRDEDQWESAALREVFGRTERAPWVTSYKGAAGHHLGAAGAFDVAMTAFGLRAGHMPPIAHHDEPEPGCGLDYVTGSARALERRTALCNTIAESGQCVSVALRAVA